MRVEIKFSDGRTATFSDITDIDSTCSNQGTIYTLYKRNIIIARINFNYVFFIRYIYESSNEKPAIEVSDECNIPKTVTDKLGCEWNIPKTVTDMLGGDSNG